MPPLFSPARGSAFAALPGAPRSSFRGRALACLLALATCGALSLSLTVALRAGPAAAAPAPPAALAAVDSSPLLSFLRRAAAADGLPLSATAAASAPAPSLSSPSSSLTAAAALAAAATDRRGAPFVRRVFGASLRAAAAETAAGAAADAGAGDAALESGAADGAGAAGARHQLPRVLVLTPVKNSQRHLPRFFSLLRNLSYPPQLLSLGLLDSDSDDAPPVAVVAALLAQGYAAAEIEAMSGTTATALAQLPALQAAGWAAATVARHDFGLALPTHLRHERASQLERRSALARSRNHLLFSALREEEDFVLWVDSDLSSYPPDALRRLLAARADIVVPNVVMQPGKRSYDMNSWRARGAPGDNATVREVVAFHDAEAARAAAARPAAPGLGAAAALRLEGYGETGARYLHGLRRAPDAAEAAAGAEPRVRLDAVGGAMLLVRAELHRMGLVFPPVVYRGRIETEGLSMLAMDMGTLSYGLPMLEAIHK
jgi:hypothetical protein